MPPPYGNLAGGVLTSPRRRPRVILDCKDIGPSQCEYTKIHNDTDGEAYTEDESFLVGKPQCDCKRSVELATPEGSQLHHELALHHNALVWDVSDADDEVREEDGRGAVVYRNPMVTDTECVQMGRG